MNKLAGLRTRQVCTCICFQEKMGCSVPDTLYRVGALHLPEEMLDMVVWYNAKLLQKTSSKVALNIWALCRTDCT